MSSIRFVMVGGFLGAGKTTTIGRLAQMYQEQGLKVAIVTNDQATDLVDTQTLRSAGFNVGEVAGACFCCNFNELKSTTDRLQEFGRPDVILAEPVGSCTDLVATVVQPLMQLFGDQFDVAPYGVILKPSHGRRILQGDPKAGFSPKAAYIFRKQLEEADFILINRADELSEAELEELTLLVQAEAEGVPVLRISARTGMGFDAFVELLAQRGDFGRRILEIDYDIYAEGEAELGWLNMSLKVRGEAEFVLDDLVLDIVNRLRLSLARIEAETAHLKTIGLSDGGHCVANLVSRETEAELSLASDCRTRFAEVVVNARVAIDPETLRSLVETAVSEGCARVNATADIQQTQSFRPGRPVPTHRFLSAK